jgi:hypothetical protein
MADTTAVVIRTNTALGSARVNIRIERAIFGCFGGRGLMPAGVRRLIGRASGVGDYMTKAAARLGFKTAGNRPAAPSDALHG